MLDNPTKRGFGAIALQNVLLRLIYATFREQIWQPGQLYFRLIDTNNQVYDLHDEYDVLKIIYTKNYYCHYLIYYSFDGVSVLHPLESLEIYFQKLLLPSLTLDIANQSNNLGVALQKIYTAVEAEVKALPARQKLMEHIQSSGSANMWEWIIDRSKEGKMPHLLMQFASLKGNPTHPLSKLKQGFNDLEMESYGPEFGHVVRVLVVAVAWGICRITKKQQSIFVKPWFQAYFPEVYKKWCNELKAAGFDPLNFIPIPVHPFQWKYVAKHFEEAVAKGYIINLDEVVIPAQATMSIRTLMPMNESAPFIKLPLNIQTTSMLRTHSPPRVHGGPIISRLLEEVLQKDVCINMFLRIMDEPLGIYINDEAYLQESQNPSYHLNVLYKRNPNQMLDEDEIYLPLSAAFEFSPCSGKPLILDIMNANGVQDQITALNYFRSYAWRIIRAQVGLYVGYGIALEGHQQNTKLIFDREGNLRYTLIGDLAGGVEIYEPILAMCGWNIKPDLHVTKKHLFDEGEIPEQQILHTTFNYHLFPLAMILSETYDLGLNELIQIMNEMIVGTIESYRYEPHHIKDTLDIPLYLYELDRIQGVFLEEDFQIRSLLKMNLLGTQQTIYTKAPNFFAKVCKSVKG